MWANIHVPAVRFPALKAALRIGIPVGIVVIVIIIIAVVLATRNWDDDEHTVDPELEKEGEEIFETCKPAKDNVCESCSEAADLIISNMDPEAGACEDFYKFACGHRINDESFKIASQSLKERFLAEVRSVLETSGHELMKNPKILYGICKDASKSDESELIQEVLELLENHMSVTVPRYFKPAAQGNIYLFKSVARAIAKLGVNVFVRPNIGDYAKREGKIYSLTLLPTNVRSIYRNLKYRRKWDFDDYENTKKFMNDLMNSAWMLNKTNTPVTQEKIQSATDEIFKMRKEIDALIAKYDSNESDEIICRSVIDSDYSLKTELIQRGYQKDKLYEQPIEEYINELYHGIHRNWSSSQPKDVICSWKSSLQCFVDLYIWIIDQGNTNIQFYIWFTVAYEIFRHNVDFKTELESEKLENICTEIVIDYFDIPISYYVLRNESYGNVKNIIKGVEESFRERAKTAEWISNSTLRVILSKIEDRIDLIGNIEAGLSDNFLKEYYKTLTLVKPEGKPKFLTVLGNIIAHHTKILFEKVDSKYDRFQFPMPVKFDGPRYIHTANVITIHRSTLRPPLYFGDHSTALNVLNYGSFGSIVGRRIVAGFNWEGFKYDHDGRKLAFPVTTWDSSVSGKMEKKKNCFVDLFNEYEACDKPIKKRGMDTLNFNLNDNGGIRHAYRAYKKHVATEGCGEGLPGLTDFTDDQLFFIAFASSYCDNKQHVCSEDYDVVDYPPPDVRVKKTLQNLQYFARAFNCSEGRKMNPGNKKRCILW